MFQIDELLENLFGQLVNFKVEDRENIDFGISNNSYVCVFLDYNSRHFTYVIMVFVE